MGDGDIRIIIIRGVVLLSLISLVASPFSSPAPVYAALSDPPVSWSSFTFYAVTYNGAIICDYESSSDPSNGGAAVQPADIDISSCSPNGYLPGSQPSFQYAYYDGGTPGNVTDDHLALRVRLNGNPLENSQVGFQSGHWYFLIDIDNDGWKEFAIDIDGTVGSNRPDRVYLLYNDLPTNNVTPRSGAQRSSSDVLGGDEIGVWYAAGPAATGIAQTNNHVRVLTATPTCYGGSEYWLDVQLPMSAFNVGGVQKLDPSTPARFLVSTSASATDPLQKDWMLKLFSDPIFSDPWMPAMYASKTDVLYTDSDGSGNVSPGDVLMCTVTISNSGLIPATGVVFRDPISDSHLSLVVGSVTTTQGTIDKGNAGGDTEVQVSGINISPGGSVTITFRVTILDNFPPGVSVVSDQGTVSGTNFTTFLTDDPNTPTPNDATRTPVTIPARLRITKEGPAETNPGAIITFTGTLTNYGTQPAENVVLVDQLPAGLTFVSSSHAAVYDPGSSTVTWQLGTLGGGMSIPGWVTVRVSDNVTDGTLLTNLFSVTWDGGGPATATAGVTVRGIPLLSIVKNGPGMGTAGSLLTYTGTLTNYGTAPAYNVTLVDHLPTGLTFVSSSHGAVYDQPNNTVTWSLGTVNAGASIPGWVTVQVDGGIPNGTVLTDKFSVTWEDSSGTTCGPAESSVVTTIYTAPQLTITKEGPGEVQAGSYVTFTGTLTNVGGSPAENVVLVDYLPPGLTFVSSSHTAVYDPVARTITWQLGTVGSGVAIPGWVTLHADAFLPDGTCLTNLFSVTWNGGGPATATADIIARTAPILSISKTGPAYGSPGGTLTFSITVTNTGGTSASNVVLMDALPGVYTYVSSSPTASVSGGNVIWNLGTLAGGASATVSLTVQVHDDVANGTQVINTAVVYWEDGQGNRYGPASDGLETVIYRVPVLLINKTGRAIANPGEDCTYSITVTNITGADAFNVLLVDYISDNMTYQGSNPAGSVSGDTVTWDLGTIVAGASKSVTVTLRVDPSLAQEKVLIDTAMTSWQDSLSNDYGPVSSTAQTRVSPYPLLTIDIDGPSTGEPCDTLTFTIDVTNTSTYLDAQNVSVHYYLPSGTSYVSSSSGGTYAGGVVSWDLGTLVARGSRQVTVTITYCTLPAGSKFVSLAGVVWSYPSQTSRGPVFDTTETTISVEPPAPPPPPPTPPPAPQPTPPVPPQPRPSPVTRQPAWSVPPSVRVYNLTIETVGQDQMICAYVDNSGGPGVYNLSLKINGVVRSVRQVALSSGSRQRVCWTVRETVPGNYLVEVGGQKAWFTVGDDNTVAMALLWGILGFFVTILLGLIFIVYRQRFWLRQG